MFRKLALLAVLILGAAGSSGCLMNQYSPDPNVRMEQLINQSEGHRQTGEFWRRFWFNDQPSHLTPARLHGGI
jgi:hypothetical protein